MLVSIKKKILGLSDLKTTFVTLASEKQVKDNSNRFDSITIAIKLT